MASTTMTMNVMAMATVTGWKVNADDDDDESLLMCDEKESYTTPPAPADEGLFCQLPNELIRHIYSFFDIASLGSMAQINKHHHPHHTCIYNISDGTDTACTTATTTTTTGTDDATATTTSPSLSSMAMDDETWSDLVHRRFQINTLKTMSKTFGDKTWKDAYRSLSHCNRAPKCRFTAARKVIFAKSSYSSTRNSKFRTTSDPLSVWVLLNHTENCETRRTAASAPSLVDHPFLANMMVSSDTTSAFNSRHGRRYVEFNVCLQNVKSSAGPITVDLLRTTLEVAAGMGRHEAVQVKGIMPRMIHHHRHQHAISDSIDEDTHADDDGSIILQPFDFCVVTMSFACGCDVFETDLLARALALRVAIVDDDNSMPQTNQQQERHCQHHQRQVYASFVPESDIWQCYSSAKRLMCNMDDVSNY
jgi:hypothetical protein